MATCCLLLDHDLYGHDSTYNQGSLYLQYEIQVTRTESIKVKDF